VVKTIFYKRIVLKFIIFQDNINSAIKSVIIVGYATMSNDELLSLGGACYLYHQGISSPRRMTVRTSTSQMHKIVLCLLKSVETLFTIIIGAPCIRGCVTIDVITRNHTVATRGAMQSITVSPRI
jgi:hypothetical protein